MCSDEKWETELLDYYMFQEFYFPVMIRSWSIHCFCSTIIEGDKAIPGQDMFLHCNVVRAADEG